MQIVGKERIFFLAVTTVFVINAVDSENHVKQLADLDKCRSNPCKNGGVCKVEEDSFVCICPQQFSGLRCEIGKMNLFFNTLL
ncbi:hypothetical protein TNCT_170991 [Trichonephila clavata]|uniref:EGF-like domain-containing protein n=1 Tax=Trichonephila clavata TaxID=2740835 RepID=A0A8X6H9I3_TRICU|nr:hypothetical protein TNCT_170991 [Trichonephila clavata]